jgi:hypothetical protein
LGLPLYLNAELTRTTLAEAAISDELLPNEEGEWIKLASLNFIATDSGACKADRYIAVGRRPINKPTTNKTRNAKKQNLAIVAAVPAAIPKPSTPAMIAITKNVSAQLNMIETPKQD